MLGFHFYLFSQPNWRAQVADHEHALALAATQVCISTRSLRYPCNEGRFMYTWRE